MNRRSALAMMIAGAVIILPLFSARSADPIAFGPADSYTVASTPYRMATGDFNSDGKPDVAVAHDNANYSILMNNGDGTFTKTGGVISGARLRDVAVVTLAGDTIPDLAFSDWTVFNLRVMAGDGLGGFTGPTNYATGGAADGIVAGDFNQDGYDDVAVAKRSASQVGVLLGNGGGGFDAVVNYGAGGAVMELAAGLVNGDTVLDLVTANFTSDNIGVLIGNGSGGFGAVTTVAAGNDNTDVALGDMNGDGLLDVVISNDGADGVVIMKGDGLGGFSPLMSIPTGNNPNQVRLYDLNGNGLLDIATANRGSGPGLAVALSYGFGNFTSALPFHTDARAYGLAITDVDPASLPDIITAHTNSAARVIRGMPVDADGDVLADADEAYYFTNTSNPDSDGDGLPDGLEVKHWCLRPAVNNGAADADGDGPANLAEYQAGTDPCDALADTDGDGMDDGWETAHPCLLIGYPDGTADADLDDYTNAREYRLDKDPCHFDDADGDGMPDAWEMAYPCVDVFTGDSTLDPDGDGRDNLMEFQTGRDPCVIDDWDGDLMPDYYEDLYPCLNADFADGEGDGDNDLLSNYSEYLAGTDPCVFTDQDGDGLPDGWEMLYPCVDPLVWDSDQDPDDDTSDNLTEFHNITDPCVREDIDGDGLPDYFEMSHPCLNRWQPDAGADPDFDLISNGDEFAMGDDPCTFTDTDGDGMPDGWEFLMPCVDRLTGDSVLDPDGDMKSNLTEYLEVTDPCVVNDADQDGLPDHWEVLYPCMQPASADADLDYDLDFWTNLLEYQQESDPCVGEDRDSDGMPDGWELFYGCVAAGTVDADLDPDTDTKKNLTEYQQGTDPCVVNDTDQDGMPDHWEVLYPCMKPATVDAASDYDYDFWTSIFEYQQSADPCVAEDGDGDGMPDGWEEFYGCVAANTVDADLDPDADTKTNLTEYQQGTDPCVVNDADHDGMPDHWEDLHPCMKPAVADAGLDYDQDYWSNLKEYQNGTDPCAWTDSDGDGMSDGWEANRYCLDRLAADSGLDPDNDGLTSLSEYQLKTDPCTWDSDGDGMPDGWEASYPCVDVLRRDADQNPDLDIYSNYEDYVLGLDPCYLDSRGRICVVVPSSLLPQIGPGLALYDKDLQEARFSRVVLGYNGETAAELRAALGALYAETNSLAGAVFIGDLPYVNYYDEAMTFPSDLYFMDLDGTWEDTNDDDVFDAHSGSRDLEIWVSRIKTGNLDLLGSDEAGRVTAYFNKAHRYRTGELRPEPKALIWVESTLLFCQTVNLNSYISLLSGVYGSSAVTTVQMQSYSYYTDTLMPQNYELVISASHGSPSCLNIGSCNPGYSTVCGSDFLERDPPWFFYVMGGCNVSAFNVPNYLTGIVTFNPADAGLFTVGSTRVAGYAVGDIKFFDRFTPVDEVGLIFQTWLNNMIADPQGADVFNYYGLVMSGDGSLRFRMADGDYDDDGLPNQYEQAHSCLDAGTADDQLDPDQDGLSNLQEANSATDPCFWDTDGDLIPDRFEIENHSRPVEPLDPGDSLDGLDDFDGDGIENVHEFWNNSDPWSPDPVPTPGYEVGCYYWGKSDGGIAVQPGDIVAMQQAYVGVNVDYARILPQAYDPLDLDRDMFPGPGDIALAQGMYVGLPRPGGYVSSPIALTVEEAPVSPVAVGDTTHITLSVHAQALAIEPFSPGMGVVFWVESGNAVLLGGEGTDPGEAVGNRYDVSMRGADGAPANVVVLVTGAGPVIVNAKIPACGTEPLGRWCGEVGLAAPVEINP